MTQPRSAPWSRVRTATPGVGITPARRARPPAETTPSASASSRTGPDSRVSRPITTRAPGPADAAAAAPRSRASSPVRSTPATPRTPSVPNSLRRAVKAAALALRELRPLARLLEAGLLALDLARVAREESLPLQVAAQVGVGLDERLRDAVAERAGLAGDAAAVDAGADVVGGVGARQGERRGGERLQRPPREILLDGLAVHGDGARAGDEDDSGDRGLALAGAAVGDCVGHQDATSSGTGLWAACGCSGPA